MSLDDAIRLAVDQDLEQLVSLKEREDLEEIYGIPVIVRPPFSTDVVESTDVLVARKSLYSYHVCNASILFSSRLASRSRFAHPTSIHLFRSPCPTLHIYPRLIVRS